MTRFLKTSSWSLILSLVFTLSVAHAGPGKKKPKETSTPVTVQNPEVPPAEAPKEEPKKEEPVKLYAGDDLVSDCVKGRVPVDQCLKTVYIIPSSVKANTPEQAELLKSGKVESIQLKFHLQEARLRGGLYFEAIYHKPGQADKSYGGSLYSVKGANGETTAVAGMTYDDYQYTSGLLKKDFDAMWGKWIYARNGASFVAMGGTIYATYMIASYFSKKQIMGLSFLATKAIELYKSKIGFAIMIYPTYMAAKEIYNFWNEVQNTGKYVPIWDGFKGNEAAERDWLYRVLSTGYDNATHGHPIDEKQFDIDGTYERYHATLSGKEVKMPDPEKDKEELAKAPTPLVATVPMKKDLKFANASLKNFFTKYYEDNAEDTIATPRIPSK